MMDGDHQPFQQSRLGRQLLRALRHYRVRLTSPKTLLLAVFLLLLTFALREARLREELAYVLVNASVEVGHLFLGLEARETYSAEQILDLTREEVQTALETKEAGKMFLQVINTREKVYFDTRFDEVRRVEGVPIAGGEEAASFEPDSEILDTDRWLPHLERDLTAAETWFLRVGVRKKAWFWGHLRNSFIWLSIYALLIVAWQAKGEADRRRRFGSLVDSMVYFLRRTDEETLIEQAPREIAWALDFDAVGLYLCQGDEIVPTAAFIRKGNAEDFKDSTKNEPIRIDSPYPEARALREKQGVLVNQSSRDQIHEGKLIATGRRPYALAVMSSDAEKPPIGLLSAQYHRGLEAEHLKHLTSVARLVALLIERFRSRDALERMYQQTIRNFRTVTIGTVVPFVAHNMRTPLTMIAQLTKSLRNDPSDLGSDKARDLLARIQGQTQLCFQLLDSMSVYRSLGDHSRATVFVHRGLDRVCSFFEDYLRLKNIDLVCDYQRKTEGPQILIEELDFVQVITNLLINADEALEEAAGQADYREKEPRSEIRVRARLDAEGSTVQISIEDNGPGIGPEIIERIFEEDFTTKDFGTGVGLPYCRRVIQRAKGELTAQPGLSVGACFTITLPVAGSAGESTEPSAP